jgi:hypothetical protein
MTKIIKDETEKIETNVATLPARQKLPAGGRHHY